jgi:hypothetical protein
LDSIARAALLLVGDRSRESLISVMWRTAIPIVWLILLPLSGQVRFKQEPDRILVDVDGTPYTAFYLAPGGNKPYVYPLSTASGFVVTRHFPMEEFPGETKDHPHQRGLFFAHGEINGYNFWATEPNMNNPKKGRMQLLKVADAKGGAKSGTVRALFDGQDPGGKAIMKETRTLTFFSDPKLRIIDYEVEIDPLEKLTFGDTKEGTFGIRLATSMTEAKGQGRMVSAEGGVMEEQVWGKRSPWVDYDGPVDGQAVGVAIFDHPSNPRYPTYWHSRVYGLFAANIFGVRDFTGDKSKDGSMTIEPGHPLRFRYRVVIHTGDVREAHIADLYQQYASGK